MDVFDLSSTELKISKIALDSATILVADSHNNSHGGDQTLPFEDGDDANANIAQQKQQRRGNVNLWKDLGFSSAREWHREKKSDLYRYNRKRQLEGKRELSELEFKEKFDLRAGEKSTKESDGEESISGSGEDDLSSSSNSSDDDDVSTSGEGENEGDFMHDAIRAKEKRMMKRKEKKEYEVAATSKTLSESGAKIVFQEEGEEKKCFAMYRAILLPDDVDFKGNAASAEANQTVAEAMQNLRQDREKPWVVILARGGHFAAAAFDARKVFHGQSANATIASTESVLKSKTFHRYVVRAKAGGRQSVKDQGGKTIKSAGSSMRRQNEMSLVRDVTNAMENMKEEYLNEAARIFISVSKTDARTLFDNNILSKKDPRVRKTPFMTARPTLNETKRTIAKLLAVTTTGIEIVEKKKKEVKRTRKTTTESKSKVDLEMQKQLEYEQEQAAKAKKIVETPEPELHKASRTGDVDALTQMLESACLNPQTGDGAVVDPSLPWRGKTAYLVAKDGETRDAFRRVYFKYPDAFDWESRCDVPSMLTPEMELKREEKEKDFEETKKKKEAERKKALKTKKKASASALLAAEEENMKSATGNKKSPSSVATSAKDLLASEKNAADERRTTMAQAAERRAAAAAAAAAKTARHQQPPPTKGVYESDSRGTIGGGTGV